ncbi:MAG: hypothetical protein HQ538_00950 [Parcubacteria group bacterium]|nr:hypothetical protein [Parcubacteria group bacterium]
MIKVLVVGNAIQRIKSQLFFCSELQKINDKYDFLFFIDSPDFIPYIKKYKNIKYILIGKTNDNTSLNFHKNSLFKNIKEGCKKVHFISNSSLNEFRKVFLILKQLERMYVKCKRVFLEYLPDVIIANGDRHFGIEQVILKLGRENNIKNIIPYLVYSGSKSCANSRRGDSLSEFSNNLPLTARYIFKKYSNQFLNYNNKKYLFYPPYATLALSKFGTLSKNPWQMGCGLADVICVDNENTYERYLNNDVPEGKIKLIGDVIYSNLYSTYLKRENIRNSITKKYNLSFSKKIILISLPQLAEHNFFDWDKHWIEINFLVKNLANLNENLLISLHPKMDFNKYSFLEKKYKCKIVKENLSDFLPIADLFIATFSSTIVWAVLCGVNSIIVDFYNFNYHMYDYLETPRIIKRKSQLLPVAHELLSLKQNYFEDWKQLSRSSVFNDKTIRKYNDLILEVINESK